MRKLIVTGIASLTWLAVPGCGGGGSGSGGSSDPVAQCKQLATTICSAFFGCFTKAQQEAAVDTIGDNETDCVTKWESADELNCTTEGVKCDSGQTYHADEANECVQQFEAFSCSQFMGFAAGTTDTPAACNEICQ